MGNPVCLSAQSLHRPCRWFAAVWTATAIYCFEHGLGLTHAPVGSLQRSGGGFMTDLSRYDYLLPAHLIAQQPVASRSDARCW